MLQSKATVARSDRLEQISVQYSLPKTLCWSRKQPSASRSEKNVRLAPRCLRGNKAPRGRPAPPARRQAQSPSQNPAGLGFSPVQLLQCAEFQCGSFPLLAPGLDRQTDRQAVGKGALPCICSATKGLGAAGRRGQASHRPGVPIKSPLQLGRQFRSSRCVPGQGPLLRPLSKIKKSPDFARGFHVLSKNNAG